MGDIDKLDIGQQIALEQVLLEEEKYVVDALKIVKTELRALLIERMHYHSRIKQIEEQGMHACMRSKQVRDVEVMGNTNQTAAASKVSLPTSKTSTSTSEQSLADDFNLPSLDDVLANDIELNLTVPSNPFYEQMPEEEVDELDNDDYEIEMSMLMNGGN